MSDKNDDFITERAGVEANLRDTIETLRESMRSMSNVQLRLTQELKEQIEERNFLRAVVTNLSKRKCK